jgi:hypothetical protein
LLLLAALVGGCGDGTSAQGGELLEELWAYPVSSIYLSHAQQGPKSSFERIMKIREEVLGGMPFAEAARKYSEDPATRELGGFLGFVQPSGDESFGGAVQALVPGVVAGPVEARNGVHLLLRHTYEEGRALEAASTIPAYGFFVPWTGSAQGGTRTREEAEQEAKELVGKIQRGEVDLLEAAMPFRQGPNDRPGALLGHVRNIEGSREMYDALASVEPGQFVPVKELPGGFAVIRRGVMLRALVRHLLIQHRHSPDRPLSIVRSRDEARALAEKILKDVDRSGGNWADMIRKYHEEASTQARLGSLGAVMSGGIYPSLEEVLLATEPGQVAGRVAESPVGFHILYRLR